jgi:signal transduction histidine kinase
MMGDIRIDKRLEASKDLILVDPNHLQQIFLNLIMNAADTLAEKNNGANEDRENVLIIESRDADETLELRFEDNGSGISENELFQIFDPFYTTKEPGEGTGLGLSVCYRIVEGIGGSIRAESDVGKGTTIILNLPISENGGR